MRVGIEVGGTFTDLVAVENGRVVIAKVPSVPKAPEEGALAAIEAAGLGADAIEDLVHGSTVATNAILERKGGWVAFLVTRGFRDILFLQRHSRQRIYDLAYKKPEPVVAADDIVEVDERMAADGSAAVPLDEAQAEALLAARLGKESYDAVAVCLLNGYANPAHERALRRILARLFPDLHVTLSSDITREFREYERASTTTLAAFIQKVIERYVRRMETELKARQFRGRLSIMQSNGGRQPPEGILKNPITMLVSGPAAGVVGAQRCAARDGESNLVTFDMGGTSTDVCLVHDGKPEIAEETAIDGLPVRVPMLDIVTVGAGGGSHVWIDDGGMLRVGPRSSGADPGPACYGRGGTVATLTDAHLVRGSIQAEAFLGGRMALDAGAARAAFEPLARHFDTRVEAVAEAAVRVATSSIVRAIQVVSTERGRDPRDYALVPFGGAGPLHAAAVAEALGMRTILVPPNAGVLSAYGLLVSDSVRFATETRRLAVEDGVVEAVRERFGAIREREADAFRALGIEGPFAFAHTLAMRYCGQAFEVAVEFGREEIEALTLPGLIERFETAHRQLFHHAGRGQAAEIVSLRLRTAAPIRELPEFKEHAAFAMPAHEIEIAEKEGRRRYRALARSALTAGAVQDGPALIEDATSTLLLPPGWSARVSAHQNLVVRRNEEGAR